MKRLHTDKQQEWRTDVSPEELKAVYKKRVQNGAILLCVFFAVLILFLMLVIVFQNFPFSEAVIGVLVGGGVAALAWGTSKLGVRCPVCGAWLPIVRSTDLPHSMDEPFDEACCPKCGANFREGRLPEALERERRQPAKGETLSPPVRSRTPYNKAPEVIRAEYVKQCAKISMMFRVLVVLVVLGILLKCFEQISEALLCAIAFGGGLVWFILISLWMRCPACGARLNKLSTGENPNPDDCVCPKCLTNLLTGEPERFDTDEDTKEAG